MFAKLNKNRLLTIKPCKLLYNRPVQFKFYSSDNEAKNNQENDENKIAVDGGSAELPSPGKSSGDFEFDQAVKKWRATNTIDDETMQQYFKKEKDIKKLKKQQLISMMPSHKDMLAASNAMMEDDDEITTSIDDSEKEKHVMHYNEETGEYGGPTGKEPTRYGDWERKGIVSDF